MSEPEQPIAIVGVGASAGGFEAFQKLLENLAPDTGMAFLLAQHLDPRHESRLPELLAKSTSMPVLTGVDGLQVEPNHVYVIPPNTTMGLSDGNLTIAPRPEGRPHLPVDHLFRTMAEDRRSRAIAVVLSGSGSDGTNGLCEVKAVGGITFAQSEISAKHPGMPHSAIDSGCVDFVLPPERIAQRLVEMGSHPYWGEAGAASEEVKAQDGHLRRVLAVVRSVTGVDFSMYRDSTIRRRVMRRMALHSQPSWADYVNQLEGDRKEVEALYYDLLINVTSFFRDPEVFETLKATIFPKIVQDKQPMAPIRVWVPGCSTGQEAYSIAIALVEFFDTRPIRPPIQIFATDLSDQTALDRARVGRYPESIEAEVSPDRLRRFFQKEDHVYRIEKSIRDMCVFARQNVTADPPFSHLDLISCRNVLIYLATPLQKRVVPTFHYALNPNGFLVLGTAETVGDHSDLFDIVDRAHRIYAKRTTALRLPHLQAPEKGAERATVRNPAPAAFSATDYQREADRIMLSRYAPPGVLINEKQEIVQFRGRTSPYLEAPPGEPTTNVLKMAREGLFLELRSALNEATKLRHVIRRENLRVRVDNRLKEIALEIIPVKPAVGGDACHLILFHESPSPGQPGAGEALRLEEQAVPADERELNQLRQELAATKEYLQSLVEQQDAVNEELRSANEEVLSSNEELQSTNEELETAKEELQSANEELTTVNEQLQHRNLELTQSNNDLSNLLSSINIPVVMVGGDLRIRRFTPLAKKVMNLLPTDVGRPIGDIKPAAMLPDLEPIVEMVIDRVQPEEREVEDREGRWHELRVHPYRTPEHRIDGAVIVLVDIDQRKRAEQLLKETDRRKDEFLATLAHELRNPLAPIVNIVEALRRGGDLEMQAKSHEVLYRQVQHLTRIVEDLIDVSRIVEKKIELQPVRLALDKVVENAVESCRSVIAARQHRLTVNLPAERIYVNADPVRLAQVLINLLNNAAKYTPPGGSIDVSAELRRERTPAGVPRRGGNGSATHVVLRVRDSGVGIAPELLPRIFDMFVQADEPGVFTRGGLGVGLSLARSLTEMHGGELTAMSAGPGRGSEFQVRLPLASGPSTEVREAPAMAVDAPAHLPRRVLVVDDNDDQAETLSMLLRLMGHDVRLAFDGTVALELVQSFRPDIALIDIGMPGLSGYDVARKIRERTENREIVLIAQTGWGQDQDRRKSEEAGFDHHLIKPVDITALQRIMAAAPLEAEGPDQEDDVRPPA